MSFACDIHDAPSGVGRFDGPCRLPRHRHAGAYAAIVLSGGYAEAGSAGRRTVEPGWVVQHAAFDSHANAFLRCGGVVLNLPLGAATVIRPWSRVRDPDAIARAAERSLADARRLLLANLEPAPPDAPDWPDLLHAALAEAAPIRLADWASSHGLARETLSRGFGQVFGLSPAAFRAEARARTAFRRIVAEPTPLSILAHETGFSDQAHMTRAVAALTGRTPGHWRRVTSVQDGRARAA